MTKLDDLCARLRAVRTVRFEAAGSAGTGWTGVGEGTVAVTTPPGGPIHFAERGTWRPATGGTFGFSNAYRWTPAAATLRLEHLRFGPARPVFLFDLASDAHGVWREVIPHVCGDDRYAASLSIEGRQLVVAWTISGPRKREAIRYWYE